MKLAELAPRTVKMGVSCNGHKPVYDPPSPELIAAIRAYLRAKAAPTFRGIMGKYGVGGQGAVVEIVKGKREHPKRDAIVQDYREMMAARDKALKMGEIVAKYNVSQTRIKTIIREYRL